MSFTPVSESDQLLHSFTNYHTTGNPHYGSNPHSTVHPNTNLTGSSWLNLHPDVQPNGNSNIQPPNGHRNPQPPNGQPSNMQPPNAYQPNTRPMQPPNMYHNFQPNVQPNVHPPHHLCSSRIEPRFKRYAISGGHPQAPFPQSSIAYTPPVHNFHPVHVSRSYPDQLQLRDSGRNSQHSTVRYDPYRTEWRHRRDASPTRYYRPVLPRDPSPHAPIPDTSTSQLLTQQHHSNLPATLVQVTKPGAREDNKSRCPSCHHPCMHCHPSLPQQQEFNPPTQPPPENIPINQEVEQGRNLFDFQAQCDSFQYQSSGRSYYHHPPSRYSQSEGTSSLRSFNFPTPMLVIPLHPSIPLGSTIPMRTASVDEGVIPENREKGKQSGEPGGAF